MRKLVLCVLAMTTTCMATKAQISFGPAAGFHLTSYEIVLNGKAIKDDGQTTPLGVQLGAAADLQLNRRFHLLTGALFTTNGYYSATSFNASIRQFSVHSIDVPLIATYHTGMQHQSHFFIGAGVYASYNMGGKKTVLYTDIMGNIIAERKEKFVYGRETPADLSRTAGGLIFNAGYQAKRGMFARIHYQMGLKNMYPAPLNASYTITSSNYGLTFGYLFHPKNKKERKAKAVKPKPSY